MYSSAAVGRAAAEALAMEDTARRATAASADQPTIPAGDSGRCSRSDRDIDFGRDAHLLKNDWNYIRIILK